MNEFITWLMSSEETKPLITTFLGAGAAVTIVGIGWQTFKYLITKIKRTFIVSIIINPDNFRETYYAGWVCSATRRIGEWLTNYQGFKYTKSVQFSGYEKNIGNLFGLGYGMHYVIWEKQIFAIELYRLSNNITNGKNIEVKISTIGLSKNRILDFFNHMVNFNESENLLLAKYNSKGIMNTSDLKERSIDTVILQGNLKESILKTISDFEKNSEWFKQKGINRVLGMLFYGPPGTGKTSIIRAIASEIRNDIVIIPIGAISDATLSRLTTEIPKLKSDDTHTVIYVFEDIDCVSSTKDRNNLETDERESKVSLSTLLNIIDGVDGLDNAIIIATTNHIEKLDPALIRPGRFGHHFKFDLFGYDEIQKYAEYAYGKHLPNLPTTENKIAPCMLQQILLANIDDIDGFERDVIDLIKN